MRLEEFICDLFKVQLYNCCCVSNLAFCVLWGHKSWLIPGESERGQSKATGYRERTKRKFILYIVGTRLHFSFCKGNHDVVSARTSQRMWTYHSLDMESLESHKVKYKK